VYGALPKWRSKKKLADPAPAKSSDHLDLARESLRELIADMRLPHGVRDSLSRDYADVQAMLDKLEHGHLHLSVFGRVSTGKSSLLNALIGEEKFSVSPLHGETQHSAMEAWQEVDAGEVFLIDTPGLDEAGGERREELAREVASRSDLVIFVLDGDITDTELAALRTSVAEGRPVLLALNKSDLYTTEELDALLKSVRDKTQDLVAPGHVVAVAADPRPQRVIDVDADGGTKEYERPREADTAELRRLL